MFTGFMVVFATRVSAGPAEDSERFLAAQQGLMASNATVKGLVSNFATVQEEAITKAGLAQADLQELILDKVAQKGGAGRAAAVAKRNEVRSKRDEIAIAARKGIFVEPSLAVIDLKTAGKSAERQASGGANDFDRSQAQILTTDVDAKSALRQAVVLRQKAEIEIEAAQIALEEAMLDSALAQDPALETFAGGKKKEFEARKRTLAIRAKNTQPKPVKPLRSSESSAIDPK